MPRGDSPKWKGRSQIGILSGGFSLPAAPRRTSKAQAKRKKGNPQFWWWLASLDHPVRPRQHVRRDRQANLLSRFQIDHKIELHRLLDGQVCRFSPVKNAVYKVSTTTIHIRITGPIRHEPSDIHKFLRCIQSRSATAVCRLNDYLAIGKCQRVSKDDDCINVVLSHYVEGIAETAWACYWQGL